MKVLTNFLIPVSWHKRVKDPFCPQGNIYLNITGMWERHKTPSQCTVFGLRRTNSVRGQWCLLEPVCGGRGVGMGCACIAFVSTEGDVAAIHFSAMIRFPQVKTKSSISVGGWGWLAPCSTLKRRERTSGNVMEGLLVDPLAKSTAGEWAEGSLVMASKDAPLLPQFFAQ